MKTLAIIPARGGSKRVPRKNLRAVGSASGWKGQTVWCGPTLLGRAIASAGDTAGTGEVAADVVVATDDDEMADFAHGHGCDVHWLAPELVTDFVKMELVMADVLRCADDQWEVAVLLQPTSPFRTATHVREALALLESKGCDSVVSGRLGKDVGFFVALAENIGPDGSLGPWRDRPFSQDAPPMFRENGAIYAFTRKHWEAHKQRRGGWTLPYVMTELESIDIDTEDDLKLADAIARGLGL